jgi:AcrR family transcriptional regulator
MSTRARFREQVREEAKAVALEQVATAGPAGVSVNAIGRALGVSGPALYRYFANRDELLTELVADAYADLAAALRAAEPTLAALAAAYRAFATGQPHRYRLLFGPPFPGYDAQAERLVDASQPAMEPVLVATGGDLGWAVRTWSRLHGFVSLEIGGNFASMGLDADALFDAEVAALLADPSGARDPAGHGDRGR